MSDIKLTEKYERHGWPSVTRPDLKPATRLEPGSDHLRRPTWGARIKPGRQPDQLYLEPRRSLRYLYHSRVRRLAQAHNFQAQAGLALTWPAAGHRTVNGWRSA